MQTVAVPSSASDLKPARSREVWADSAKAVCILLVVLLHASNKHFLLLPWDIPHPVEVLWRSINAAMTPFRLPLFWLISGFFAERAVSRPWRQVVGRRVTTNYWVYAVWTTLLAAFFVIGPALDTNAASSVGDWLLSLALGYSSIWYLYALAAYFVVAKLVKDLPLWLPLLLAVVLALAVDVPGFPHLGNSDSLLANLCFFLVGALAPHVVRSIVVRSSTLWATAAVAIYVVCIGLARVTGTSDAIVVSTLLGVIGAAAGVAGFAWFAQTLPAAASRVAWLGRRTLPVYVMHLMFLAILDWAVRHISVQAPLSVALQIGLLAYPLIATAAVTATALAAHRLLLQCRLRVLFSPPERLTRQRVKEEMKPAGGARRA